MKKKTVAISGGLGKIGLGLALKLSKKNFNVLIGDKNEKKFKLVKKKLNYNSIKFFKVGIIIKNKQFPYRR